MKNYSFAMLAACLVLAPGIASAQTTVGVEQGTNVATTTGAQAVSENHFDAATPPDPVGNVSVFTPAPSAPCQGTGGFAVGAPNAGVGASWSRTNENCDRREDARMMLAIAAAALQTEGPEAAAEDVRVARQIMMDNDRIQAAVLTVRRGETQGPTQ